MTAPLTFDVTAAQNALTRADEGQPPQPSDLALTAAYDQYLQQKQAVLEAAWAERDRQDWLATQCQVHVSDATGPECDSCFLDHDQAMRRADDI